MLMQRIHGGKWKPCPTDNPLIAKTAKLVRLLDDNWSDEYRKIVRVEIKILKK